MILLSRMFSPRPLAVLRLHAVLLTAALCLFVGASAHAACSNPTAEEASIVYNDDYNIMMFCDGTQWQPMGGGSGSDTLAGLSCANGQVASWDNSGGAWVCADVSAGSTAWGDLSGVPADIADGDDDTLADLSCGNNEIAKWNGSAWACAANDTGGNPDWSDIQNRPAGLDDGDDVGITSESDPTVQANVKDGVSWSELSGIPAGFADGTDDGADNLGNHTATQALNMSGNNITSAGDVTASAYFHSSDIRLKRDVAPANGLEILTAIKGVTYNWKDSGKPAAGVVAQDVEKVMPYAVSTGPDGMKAVEYDQLLAPVIEAIKTLAQENQALGRENESLKKRVEALEARKDRGL